MIGAAGARRFAAGERAGLDLDARPSLPLAVRGRGRMSGDRAAAASTRETVRTTLRAAGLRARHSLSQNFLADPDVLDAILARGRPGARPPGPRDRARASGS